jgi:hypothetical protein
MLNDVEFREAQEMAKVDKVKIVACDGKSGFPASQILLPLQLQLEYKLHETDMVSQYERNCCSIPPVFYLMILYELCNLILNLVHFNIYPD